MQRAFAQSISTSGNALKIVCSSKRCCVLPDERGDYSIWNNPLCFLERIILA